MGDLMIATLRTLGRGGPCLRCCCFAAAFFFLPLGGMMQTVVCGQPTALPAGIAVPQALVNSGRLSAARESVSRLCPDNPFWEMAKLPHEGLPLFITIRQIPTSKEVVGDHFTCPHWMEMSSGKIVLIRTKLDTARRPVSTDGELHFLELKPQLKVIRRE